jgi:Zn-dependent protease with chaperone function
VQPAKKRRLYSISISHYRRLDGLKMLQASYFDGRSTRVRAVNLDVIGEDLVVAGEDIDLRIPFANVKVDERLGRAPRRLRLENGAFCEVRDLDALDTLLSSTAHRDGWVDRMQRHLQFVLFACVVCMVLTVVAYKWGLPWASAVGAHHLPSAISKTLSARALQVLDGGILMPSKIAEERQQALSAEFHALRLPEGGTPDSALLFRRSPQLGANAFTLPDGTIIVLDDLITSIGDDRQTLAVLAHELGHAHGRHGMQMLLQSSAVGAFLAFYIGDISHLLAAAPAAVVQARYSQDFEQQADDYGAALLLHNGMSPGLLADALKKLAELRPEFSKGGYLSSHPSTDERMRRLRLLAASFAAT